MKDSLYWKKASGNSVRCELCPFECLIPDGGHGQCRVRVNKNGQLVSTVYQRVSGSALDPVEKKPLYHWFPGREILSIGTMGCNLHCRFCQNSDISQTGGLTLEEMSPERLLASARAQDSVGVAFTYSEPSVWIETILSTAPVFHDAGLKTAMITNGYINPKPLKDLVPHIDAMNIDVKSFREEYYHKVCGASLAPVLKNVEFLAKTGIWLELTMLIVPGLNDSSDEIRDFCRWVAGIDRSIPVHFSRYFPRYKMETPATPEETLLMAAKIGREHLDFVYVGNVCLPEGCATKCVKCGHLLIRRHAEGVETPGLGHGVCTNCANPLAGRF